MIFDRTENWDRYFRRRELLSVCGFLSQDLSLLPIGKVEICGDLVFALVSEYSTKAVPDCPLESHEQFADVHLLACGEERLDSFFNCQMKTPYREATDSTLFFRPDFVRTSCLLVPGFFVLYPPQEIHSPQIALHDPVTVKKIVIKIAKNLLTLSKTAE